MTSRKSYFNLNLFKESVKQQKYIILLHTIFLFLCTTLPALILNNNMSEITQKADMETIAKLLSGYHPLMIPLITAAAIITAIFLFNYLYKQQSVLFYHSMEHSRESLYISRFLSGVFTLILPLIPLAVINTAVFAALGIGKTIGAGIMLKGILSVALMYICVFAVSCFAASVSGNFFAQLCIIAFVFLVYVISTALIQGSIGLWFSFMSIEFYYNEVYIFPPLLLARYAYDKINVSEIIYVILYTIAFAAAGLVLYKYRKSENTGKFFVYGKLTSFLKYYLAFFSALCFGLIFLEMSQRSVIIALFGYLIGAFLAFVILQGIFGKNFKAMFENMRGFAILAVCTLAVVILPLAKPQMFYIIPKAEKINEFAVGTSGNGYYNSYNLKSPENISSVLTLISAEKSGFGDYSVTAVANPNNKIYSLQYSLNVSESDYNKYMKSIYDTKEYKTLMLSRINAKALKNSSWINITRNTTFSVNTESGVNNSEEVKELLNLFRQEYGKYTYDDIDKSRIYAVLNIYGNNYNVYDCYVNTVNFINEKYSDNIEYSTDGLLELDVRRYESNETQMDDGPEDANIHEIKAIYTADKDMDEMAKILSESIESGSTNANIKLIYNDGHESYIDVNIDNYSHDVKESILKRQMKTE